MFGVNIRSLPLFLRALYRSLTEEEEEEEEEEEDDDERIQKSRMRKICSSGNTKASTSLKGIT